MNIKHKTISAASIAALDIAVNAFIGNQTVDSRQIQRNVTFYTTYLSGGVFYASFIYTENVLNNT